MAVADRARETSGFASAEEPRRNPALDGLRGVAVLLVVASHAAAPVFRLGGAAGVTLFFVLSGYLITTLVVREREETGRINLAHFYARRALRLVPALVVAVAGGAALAIAFGASTGDTGFAALASLLYLNNLSTLFDRPMAPFANLWSLSVEEQFYIVWPFAIAVLGAGRRQVLLVAAAVSTVLSLGARFAGSITTADGYSAASALPHTNAWAPLFGSVLALALANGWRPRLTAQHATVALTFLLAVASALGLTMGWREEAGAYTYVLRLLAGPLAALGAAVLVLFAVDEGRRWRVLTHPALLFLGSISYALYLWHGILDHVLGRQWGSSGVRGLVVGSAAAVLATGLAVLSRRYVELPFLRRKRAFERIAAAV